MANIDVVDIGGASRMGVPEIGGYRDADGTDEDDGERFIEPVKQTAEVPPEVQKAVAPGASVAYPNEHPANSGRLQMDPGGAMIVPKGTALTQSLLTKPRDVSEARKASEKELDKLLAEETEAKTTQNETIAKSAAGVPLFEVLFHTEIGAIVGYFNKVVRQGRWLVLVTDNRSPAQAKFIPKQREEGEPVVFDLVITGADRVSQRVTAMPLNIQFTVGTEDFVVMKIET